MRYLLAPFFIKIYILNYYDYTVESISISLDRIS